MLQLGKFPQFTVGGMLFVVVAVMHDICRVQMVEKCGVFSFC